MRKKRLAIIVMAAFVLNIIGGIPFNALAGEEEPRGN